MAKRLGKRRVIFVGLMLLGLIGAFVGGAYGNHVFTDVPTNAYYHPEVTWLSANGIVAGCGGGKYCPNDPITRGQAAEVFYKFATRTRYASFSCDAYGFSAASSTTAYNIGVSGVYADGYMACPVHIPDGATVYLLSGNFYDLHASNASVNLVRTEMIPGTTISMGFAATSGNSGTEAADDQSIASPVIDNGTYSYYVLANFAATNSPNLTLRGVRVAYSYPGIPAP